MGYKEETELGKTAVAVHCVGEHYMTYAFQNGNVIHPSNGFLKQVLYNSHFTDKKTETQRQGVICLRSHREPVLKPGLKPKSPDPWPWARQQPPREGPRAVAQWLGA